MDKTLSNVFWPYSWPWMTMVVCNALYCGLLLFLCTAKGLSPTALLLALPPAEGDITTGITTRIQWGSIFLLVFSLQRRALVFSFHIYLEKTFSFWFKHSSFHQQCSKCVSRDYCTMEHFPVQMSMLVSLKCLVPQKHNCIICSCTDFTITTRYYSHNTSSEMLKTLCAICI